MRRVIPAAVIGFVLVALLIVATPYRAHTDSATPVRVTNAVKIDTTDQPVRVFDVASAMGPEPFQHAGYVSGPGEFVIATVPAGKRLVMEHVSARCRYSGEYLSLRVGIREHGKNWYLHHVPFSAFDVWGNDYIVSMPLRLYGGPGTQVLGALAASLKTADTETPVQLEVVVTGYLLDVDR